MKKKSKFARYSIQDKALLITGYILLGLFVVAIIIPMIYIIVASFMDPITLHVQCADLGWFQKCSYLFGSIYSSVCIYHASGSISDVQSGF